MYRNTEYLYWRYYSIYFRWISCSILLNMRIVYCFYFVHIFWTRKRGFCLIYILLLLEVTSKWVISCDQCGSDGWVTLWITGVGIGVMIGRTGQEKMEQVCRLSAVKEGVQTRFDLRAAFYIQDKNVNLLTSSVCCYFLCPSCMLLFSFFYIVFTNW